MSNILQKILDKGTNKMGLGSHTASENKATSGNPGQAPNSNVDYLAKNLQATSIGGKVIKQRYELKDFMIIRTLGTGSFGRVCSTSYHSCGLGRSYFVADIRLACGSYS